MPTKIIFDINSEEGEEDRTTISINGIGEVVLVETYPEYEFLDDVGEDALEELNLSTEDVIGKIEHLEIKDKYKGQGYAKLLMKKAIAVAKEKGLMPLYLNASPMGSKRYGLNLDDLTGFYESLGFEVFLQQGGNNLMILKDTYKTGGETKNKIMENKIKFSKEEQKDFNFWKQDGNVSKNEDGSYSTQDAQWTNRLKDLDALKEYYFKEFLNGSRYAGGGTTSKLKVFNVRDIKVGDKIYARWNDSLQWSFGIFKGETKNGFEVYDRTIERPEYIEFYAQISKSPPPYGDKKIFYSKNFKDRNYKNYHFIKEIQQGNYKKGGRTMQNIAKKQARKDIKTHLYRPQFPDVSSIKPSEKWARYELPYDTKLQYDFEPDSFSVQGNRYSEYAKGGEAGFDDTGTSMVMYHEKKGNFFVAKDTVYLWFYNVENSAEKIESGEFDYVLYPFSSLGMMGQKGFIPPLKKIWTKKFQKKTKGSEHLLGVIKAFLIEEKGKKELYIDMMSVNPTKKKKGVMSYMIKDLRDTFDLTQEQITFSDLTDEGKKFLAKKTYDDGGGIGSNDEEKYNEYKKVSEKYQTILYKLFHYEYSDKGLYPYHKKESEQEFIVTYKRDNYTPRVYLKTTPQGIYLIRTDLSKNYLPSEYSIGIGSGSTGIGDDREEYSLPILTEKIPYNHTKNKLLVEKMFNGIAELYTKVELVVNIIEPMTLSNNRERIFPKDITDRFIRDIAENNNIELSYDEEDKIKEILNKKIFDSLLEDEYNRENTYADGGGIGDEGKLKFEDLVGKYFEIELGSSGTSTEWESKELLAYLKKVVTHNLFDSEFYYNWTDSDEKKQYLDIFTNDTLNEIFKNVTNALNKYFEFKTTAYSTNKKVLVFKYSNDFRDDWIDNWFKTNKKISVKLKVDYKRYREKYAGVTPYADGGEASELNIGQIFEVNRDSEKGQWFKDLIHTQYPFEPMIIVTPKYSLQSNNTNRLEYNELIEYLDNHGWMYEKNNWSLNDMELPIINIFINQRKEKSSTTLSDLKLWLSLKNWDYVNKYADGGDVKNKIQLKNFSDLKQGDVIRKKERHFGTTIFVVNKSPVQSRIYKNEYDVLVTCIVSNTNFYKPFEEYYITSVIKYGKLGNVDYLGKWNYDDKIDYSIYLPKSNKKYADGGEAGYELENYIISGKNFKNKYATDFNGEVAKVIYTKNLDLGSNLGKGSYWNVTQDSLDIYSGKRDEELDSKYGQYFKNTIYKKIDDNLKIFVKDEIADELWDNEKLYNKIKNISDGIYDPSYDDYGLLLFDNKYADGGIIDSFVDDMVKNQIARRTIKIKDQEKFIKFMNDIQPYIDKKIVRVKVNPINKEEVWVSLQEFNQFADGGEIYVHKYNPNITLEFIENTNKGIKGLQKNPKSLSKKERKEGIIVNYSDSEIKELFNKKFADGGDVPHEDKMFQLPLEMVIYVPSTQDVDKVISIDDMILRVDEVKKYLANKFGGYTSADKLGGFVDSTGNLVNEDVVQVTSFSTKEAYAENKEELINQLAKWCEEWGQESIGFEFEGDLMYVPNKFKKGGQTKNM